MEIQAALQGVSWQHTGQCQSFSSFEANCPWGRVWSDDTCSPGLREYYLAKPVVFSSRREHPSMHQKGALSAVQIIYINTQLNNLLKYILGSCYTGTLWFVIEYV